MDRDVLTMCVLGKMATYGPTEGGSKIQLVTDSKLEQFYEKNDDENIRFIRTLEVIAKGLNFITEGKVGKAKEEFYRQKMIPLNSGEVDKLYQTFEQQVTHFKWLILEVVIASAKCIFCEIMQILTQENKFGKIDYDYSNESQIQRSRLLKWKQ